MDEKTELEEYQEFVKECRIQNDKEYFVTYPVIGMCAEAGEVLEIVQKGIRKNQKDWSKQVDKFRDELGDVIWYLACVCNDLGITIDEVIENNIDKLRKCHAIT